MRYNSYRLNAVILDIDCMLDGRTHTWLYQKLGMKRSTYYWKKKNGFKPEEAEQISKVLGVEFK